MALGGVGVADDSRLVGWTSLLGFTADEEVPMDSLAVMGPRWDGEGIEIDPYSSPFDLFLKKKFCQTILLIVFRKKIFCYQNF